MWLIEQAQAERSTFFPYPQHSSWKVFFTEEHDSRNLLSIALNASFLSYLKQIPPFHMQQWSHVLEHMTKLGQLMESIVSSIWSTFTQSLVLFPAELGLRLESGEMESYARQGLMAPFLHTCKEMVETGSRKWRCTSGEVLVVPRLGIKAP